MRAEIKGDEELLIDLKLPNGCQHQILSIVTTYLAVDTIEVIMTSLSDPELSDNFIIIRYILYWYHKAALITT